MLFLPAGMGTSTRLLETNSFLGFESLLESFSALSTAMMPSHDMFVNDLQHKARFEELLNLHLRAQLALDSFIQPRMAHYVSAYESPYVSSYEPWAVHLGTNGVDSISLTLPKDPHTSPWTWSKTGSSAMMKRIVTPRRPGASNYAVRERWFLFLRSRSPQDPFLFECPPLDPYLHHLQPPFDIPTGGKQDLQTTKSANVSVTSEKSVHFYSRQPEQW